MSANDHNTPTKDIALDKAVVAVIQAEVSVAVQPFMDRMEEIAEAVKTALSDHEKRLDERPTKSGVRKIVQETVTQQIKPALDGIKTELAALNTKLDTNYQTASANRDDINRLEVQADLALNSGEAALRHSTQLRVDIMGTPDKHGPISIVDQLTDAITGHYTTISTKLTEIAGNQIRHHERIEILETDHRRRLKTRDRIKSAWRFLRDGVLTQRTALYMGGAGGGSILLKFIEALINNF